MRISAARARKPGIRKTVFIGAFVLALALGAILAASASAATITYDIYATDGYVKMADGTNVYIYGFVGGRAGQPFTYQNSAVAPPKAPAAFIPGAPVTIQDPWGVPALEAQLAGNAQFPAPVIYAAVNDVVEIRFKNLGVTNKTAPNDPHSIHLHGLDVNAANDGVPETSVAAVPANAALPGAGNVVVYMFTPQQAGTYMYHCHQEADIHVQMGMYGALVVYNPTDPAYLNGGPGKGFGGNLHGWDYDKDYILLLSEFDLGQHVAEQRGGLAGAYNPVNFKPQYWFINGLSFPNTVHAGAPPFSWANWFAAHPNYDPFITGSVAAKSAGGPAGEQVLLRVINMGFQAQPMHMHGYHAHVIGSDQRAWPWASPDGPNAYGTGMEKNTLLVGSGETYEWIIDMSQQALTSTYPAGTQTRYNTNAALGPLGMPVVNTDLTMPAIPDPFVPGFAYIGGPTVGPDAQASQGPGGLPPDLPFVAGQFFPFHNHDDYKATNNGAYPGGMFTMILTEP